MDYNAKNIVDMALPICKEQGFIPVYNYITNKPVGQIGRLIDRTKNIDAVYKELSKVGLICNKTGDGDYYVIHMSNIEPDDIQV
jgi:hypothetical protein